MPCSECGAHHPDGEACLTRAEIATAMVSPNDEFEQLVTALAMRIQRQLLEITHQLVRIAAALERERP